MYSLAPISQYQNDHQQHQAAPAVPSPIDGELKIGYLMSDGGSLAAFP
jgi:hypothetical protein